jgi:drug/metabolite transporter (DMT)-like permease
LLTAFFWGGTFVAGRFLAKDVTPFSAAFLRFAVASACLLLIVWKVEGRLPLLGKNQIIPVILLGMSGIFTYNVFFFKGLKLIDAGRAALIISTNPILITLCSAYFFKEHLNFVKSIGIAISVSGAMIVISRGNLLDMLNGHLGIGEVYIFGAVISWVIFSLIGKAVLSDLSPLISVSYSSAVGAIALMIPALSEGMAKNIGQYSGMDWLSIFYLSIFGTVIGFIWYYQGIRSIGPTKAGLFINFVPISAIILAFLILNEPLTISLFIGAVFVSTGVYLTNSASYSNAVSME